MLRLSEFTRVSVAIQENGNDRMEEKESLALLFIMLIEKYPKSLGTIQIKGDRDLNFSKMKEK